MDRHRSRTPNEAAQEQIQVQVMGQPRAGVAGPGAGGGCRRRDLARSDLGRYVDERYCIACLSTLSAGVLFKNVLYYIIRFVIEAEVKSGASRGRRRSRPKKKKRIMSGRPQERRGRRGGGGVYGQSV